MRAAERVTLYRSSGDTDPISVILRQRSDEGLAPIPDIADKELRVKNGVTIVQISGVAKGDSSGTFTFSTADILGFVGVFPFEIYVDDGVFQYIAARGKLSSVADMV